MPSRCPTKDCPFTPDEHEEFMELCSRVPGHEHRHDKPSHQHVPKKGMGGNNPESKIRAILCLPLHDAVDNGTDFDNTVTPGEEGQEVYILWDTRVENGWEHPLISRVIGGSDGQTAQAPSLPVRSDGGDVVPLSGGEVHLGAPRAAAEKRPETPKAVKESRRDLVGGSAAAPAASGLSASEEAAKSRSISIEAEAAKEIGDPTLPRAEGGDITPESVSAHTSSAALSHEAWEREMWQYSRVGRSWRWGWGDKANEGEDTDDAFAWKVLTDIADNGGYTYASIRNMMRICKAVPEYLRREDLSWGYYQVIYSRDKETMEAWLERAATAGWSVKQFRDELRVAGLLPAKQPKPNRWTLEDLRRLWGEWPALNRHVESFFDWLEEHPNAVAEQP